MSHTVPPLDPIAAVCTISTDNLAVGERLSSSLTGPYNTVSHGKLYKSKDEPWSIDVVIHTTSVSRCNPSSLKHLERIRRLLPQNDPNVLFYYGIARKEETIYVVTEPTTDTLRSRLEGGAALDSRACLDILLQVAKGMRRLHAADIVHRMLTTDCVHITQSGEAKVGNFEYSRAFANKMTNIGMPYYSAPEILTGAINYTEKVDVYSFAMMIVEVVTKKEPYSNVNAPEAKILQHIVQHHYRPVFTPPAEWPDGLFQLMKECWDADPEKRPTFDAIVSRLDAMRATSK